MKLSWEKRVPFFFLIFLFIAISFRLLDTDGFFRPVRGKIESLIVPMKTTVYNWRNPKVPISPMEEDLLARERRIALLESQIENLKGENVSLRRLLGAPLPNDWRYLPAKVIGQPSFTGLLINKGKDSELEEGMVVVAENVLVGRIVQVGEYYSQVQLPFSNKSKILAISQHEETDINKQAPQAKGLVIGQGGKMTFERVLLKETLETSDIVLTAGDEVFPQGLLIGKLGSISKKENEVYQSAEIEPLLSLETIDQVFVLTYY